MAGRPERESRPPRPVPPGERLVSALILTGLVGIAVAVCWRGQRYDPDLFRLDARLLPEAGAGGPPAAIAAAPELVTPGDAKGPSCGQDPLAELLPGGWQPSGPPERYPAEQLYVKIDGRAELYLAYDVVELRAASISSPIGDYLDLYVYDMGSPLNAFGIFSAERPPDAAPVPVGDPGYQAASSVAFCRGPCYAQIIASADTPQLRQQALAVAGALAARLPAGRAGLWGHAYLPQAGQLPNSLQYVRRDALGLEFVDSAFTATYERNGQELSAFVALHRDSLQAAATDQAFQAYWRQYGAAVTSRRQAAGVIALADLGGYHDAVFRRGRLVGGVVMAADPEAAAWLAVQILDQAGHQPANGEEWTGAVSSDDSD